MFKCIFIKRKLYDYLDNSLCEPEKNGVERHLKTCSACQDRLNKMADLLALAKQKVMPEFSKDFWHNFHVGLDEKLNARLVSPLIFKPNLSWRLAPALALSLVLVSVLTGSFYFYYKSHFLSKSDLALIDEVSLLEEVMPEAGFDTEEDIYITEEFNQLST